jgi:hypothetical protein
LSSLWKPPWAWEIRKTNVIGVLAAFFKPMQYTAFPRCVSWVLLPVYSYNSIFLLTCGHYRRHWGNLTRLWGSRRQGLVYRILMGFSVDIFVHRLKLAYNWTNMCWFWLYENLYVQTSI